MQLKKPAVYEEQWSQFASFLLGTPVPYSDSSSFFSTFDSYFKFKNNLPIRPQKYKYIQLNINPGYLAWTGKRARVGLQADSRKPGWKSPIPSIQILLTFEKIARSS